ncbi:hypothetical protein KKA02_01405 [Patescibacteria group bacterium]|nr:hypothetical protein [Patescibacteria group bacterium]
MESDRDIFIGEMMPLLVPLGGNARERGRVLCGVLVIKVPTMTLCAGPDPLYVIPGKMEYAMSLLRPGDDSLVTIEISKRKALSLVESRPLIGDVGGQPGVVVIENSFEGGRKKRVVSRTKVLDLFR